MKMNKHSILPLTLVTVTVCLAPAFGHTEIVTSGEARQVANNWLAFVVERDGEWAGSTHPSLLSVNEINDGEMLLGYYAAVKPQGYIIVSSTKYFPPILAYSYSCNLNVDSELGLFAFSKAILRVRIESLITNKSSRKELLIEGIPGPPTEDIRLTWSYLMQEEEDLSSQLYSISPSATLKVGPLLKTEWHQGPPYNERCPIPDISCSYPSYPGCDNQHALVGCVPLAVAQVMRYYCWPPINPWLFEYDWPNILTKYSWDVTNKRFLGPDGLPCTQRQIDAVAELCSNAGYYIVWDYECARTGAVVTSWFLYDARDVLEDKFWYSNPEEDEPGVEERDSYTFDEWWNIIKAEIDNNRPVIYQIADAAVLLHDFAHCIVLDGYDSSVGYYMVHANYGWDCELGNEGWFDRMVFYCDSRCPMDDNDENGQIDEGDICSWDEEEMIYRIYPRTALPSSFSGDLHPILSWVFNYNMPYYIYQNVVCFNTTIKAGVRIQFLPGTKLSSSNSILVHGQAGEGTRFFSKGDTSYGLKLNGGGMMRFHSGGEIRMQ
ncbi:MAG: C10 family peptidase [bacterium]